MTIRYRLPNLSGDRIKECYARFREHCIQGHGLREADKNAEMHFDKEKGTLTLYKDG